MIALLLATIGISAVTAYAVSQRTHEVGIRMALGAQRKSVVLLVMRQGLLLTLFGLALGLVLTPALQRLLTSVFSVFQDVSKLDPVAYVGVSVLFLAVTLLACYLPALRATKVNPVVALRHE
jgi:putative ABC transport system permease protein